MRDFKSMKRQRGRNRKPGGGGGGSQGHGNNPNRAFDSNGPEGLKVRGNAQHVYERYQQLARDATAAGDRVLAENFLQHAEHYFRLIRAMQPNRPVAEIAARDATAAGFDIDFEDESGIPQVAEGFEAEGQQPQGGEGGDQAPRENRDRDDYRRDRDNNRDRDGNRDRGEYRGDRDNRDRDGNRDRPRDDRPRDDRPRDDRPRDDRPRDDRPRDDRPRDDRPRDDRPRDDRPRDDRPASGDNGEGRRETRRERFERQRGERRPRYGEEGSGDPLAVVEPQAAPLVERAEEASPVLRADDGGESHMPAFLGRAPKASKASASPADEPAAEKPKRAPRKKKAAEPAGEDA